MPNVPCPKCSRVIPLTDADLLLVIECSNCGTQFGPLVQSASQPTAEISREEPIADEVDSGQSAVVVQSRSGSWERGIVPLVLGAFFALSAPLAMFISVGTTLSHKSFNKSNNSAADARENAGKLGSGAGSKKGSESRGLEGTQP
jgi:hypothetical protein